MRRRFYYILGGAVAVVTLAYAALLYTALPELIPLRFDDYGRAVGWRPRSWIFLFPGGQLILLVFGLGWSRRPRMLGAGLIPANRIPTEARRALEENTAEMIASALFLLSMMLLAACQLVMRAALGQPLGFPLGALLALMILLAFALTGYLLRHSRLWQGARVLQKPAPPT